MKKNILFILLTLFIFSCNKKNIEPNKPFPQQISYSGNYILPNDFSRVVMNNQVSDFYDSWKKEYLKKCDNNNYFIDYNNQNWNVSEGLGYGMIIVAYMAGYDKNARDYFIGMYNFYKNHPSSINPNLMAWQQIENCITNPDQGDDAASDGDIDIAFSLLLADKQWGSNGSVNFKKEAENIISAIMKDEINPDTWAVKLGDWASDDDEEYFFGTRSSDFIIDHFRAFKTFSQNNNWQNVIDECYSILNSIQSNYSPNTGLIPDFIIAKTSSINPANANYLESEYDGDLYYNACRTPWRITTDFLTSGDTNAYNTLHILNTWIYNNSQGNPDNIKSGYLLDGTPIGADYQDICFYGAFAVSAMLETDKQEWLNSLYQKIIDDDISDNDYFGNTLKMLYLLTLSANWWQPY